MIQMLKVVWWAPHVADSSLLPVPLPASEPSVIPGEKNLVEAEYNFGISTKKIILQHWWSVHPEIQTHHTNWMPCLIYLIMYTYVTFHLICMYMMFIIFKNSLSDIWKSDHSKLGETSIVTALRGSSSPPACFFLLLLQPGGHRFQSEVITPTT